MRSTTSSTRPSSVLFPKCTGRYLSYAHAGDGRLAGALRLGVAPAAGGATYPIAYEGDAAGDPTVDRHIYGRIRYQAAVFLPLALRND